METTGLFNQNNPDIKFSQLCIITKDRIESFLPGLWEDLFKIKQPPAQPVSPPSPQPSEQQPKLDSPEPPVSSASPVDFKRTETPASQDSESTLAVVSTENETKPSVSNITNEASAAATPHSITKVV